MPDLSTRKIKRDGSAATPRKKAAAETIQPAGNQAAQEQARAARGPLARLFNRIVGQPEDRSPEGAAFDRAALRRYLDKNLQFAEKEWFRGKKLDGVTDALMKQLAGDANGVVTWEAFQAFRVQTLQTLAPGAQPGEAPDAVAERASKRFGQLDRSGDGSLDYGELKKGTEAALPKGTDHKDLVSQLAARIALDAADLDQRDRKVKDRDLSREEWSAAARQLAQPAAKKRRAE